MTTQTSGAGEPPSHAAPAATLASSGGGAQGEAAPCATARVFLDDQFQGASRELAAGRYDRANLEAMGVENDTVRSVCVPPGWRVTLYEDEGFAGRTLELTQSSGALGDFAQSATAIVVQAP
ncbi:MAG: hypothetical protein R3A48_23255 [Polyangiales bacterium]